jgi:hypothetical protein
LQSKRFPDEYVAAMCARPSATASSDRARRGLPGASSMGAVILLGYVVYAVLTLVLMVVGGKVAKRYGKPADLVWIIVFFTSFLFVFWDTVPTLAVHSYLCHRDYGFREFKSLEQWKEENPGVAETLVPIPTKGNSETRGDLEVMHLNERFDWQREREWVLLSARLVTQRIVDIATGDVLAEYVDVASGRPLMRGGILAYKFWLFRPDCNPSGPLPEKRSFSEFMVKSTEIGESR